MKRYQSYTPSDMGLKSVNDLEKEFMEKYNHFYQNVI